MSLKILAWRIVIIYLIPSVAIVDLTRFGATKLHKIAAAARSQGGHSAIPETELIFEHPTLPKPLSAKKG